MVDKHDADFADTPEWGPANTRPVTDASQRLRVARARLGLTQAGMAVQEVSPYQCLSSVSW